MMTRSIVVLLGALSLLVVIATAVRSDHRDDHARIAVVRGRLDSLSVYIATNQGIAQREKLEIEVFEVPTSGQAIDFLANRKVDAAMVGGSTAIQVHRQKGGVHIIAVSAAVPPYSVIGRADINRLQDLRDKAIGASPGEETFFLSAALTKVDITPGQYRIVSIPILRERIGRLERGDLIQGAIVPWPFHLAALSSGLRTVAEVPDVVPRYAYGVVVVEEEWPKKFRPAVVTMLKTLLIANRWILENDNASEARSLIRKYLNSLELPTGDREVDHVYVLLRKYKFLSPDMELNRELFQVNMTATGGDMATVKWDELLDRSFLNDARRQLQSR